MEGTESGHRFDPRLRCGLVQVISLGTHLIEATSAEPMLLMEVMPSILAKRSFPAPATHEQIEPGYRDAPDPSHNCVIVFSRVRHRYAAETDASAVRSTCGSCLVQDSEVSPGYAAHSRANQQKHDAMKGAKTLRSL